MRTAAVIGLVVVLGGCAGGAGESGGGEGPLVVYNAGSLGRPLRAVLDSFSAATGVPYQQENAGSLETARKLTELGKIPDVIALADYTIFPAVLVPSQTSWYAQFARNRMVVAYTDRSRLADSIGTDSWYEILQRPGVQTGRANPDLDPAGYRALLVMQLAERHYGVPGLAARLLAASPERNVRPKEADLVALLQAGELDYAWEYESLARESGLRFVRLPNEIDLGFPADSAFYAQATTAVRGATPADTIVVRGQPIVYGLSIPARAPHPALAARFVAFMLGEPGRRTLLAEHLNLFDRPVLVGSGAPDSLAALMDRAP